MKKSLPILKIFTILLAFVLTTSMVKAQTRTASVSGNWSNTATWGGASVPTSANDVVINNGITVTVDVAAACNSITIGATNIPGGITISGTNSLAVTNAVSIGDLTDNTSGILIAVGAGSFSCASFTMADVTGSNDDIALTVSTGSVTVSGALTMNGAAAENRVDITGAGSLTVGSLSPVNGTFNNSATSTVSYTGGTQTIRVATYQNLTLSGTGAKTVSGITVNGTLSLQGTTTAAGTSPTYGATATLEYKGSAAQATSGVEFVGTGANPTNVTINNTSGVTLNAAKSINGALTLTNGYLTTTATNLLTINAAGSASTANGAFVNGPLAKVKNSTALFTFPVGNLTGQLRTIGVTPQTATASTYVAEFKSGDPRNVTNGSNLGTIPTISACEYWDLSRSSGATPARVTVSWPAAANSCGVNVYVSNPASLIVAHHNGTNWTNEGQSSSTGDATNGGTVTSNNYLSSFSPFALGTTDVNQNPLPVMFADVKAFEKNSGVQIDWSNLTERDLIGYVVERSSNGTSFSAISQQTPRSNTNDKETYSAFDAAPLTGSNFYRIKVLEISGKIIYSKVIRVDFGRSAQGLTLYPNPVTGGQVSISINNVQGKYTLKVMSTSGQEIFRQRIAHQGGSMTETIQLPASVKPGVYNMVLTGDGYRDSKMFVVQ